MYERATRLEDVLKTLAPKPLLQPEEFKAFYRDAPNKVRGGTGIDHLRWRLEPAYGSSFCKAFLMGHPGVGKSTELTRLIGTVKDKFRAIRFSVMSELDPGAFEPFDVLVLMMMRLAEETARPRKEGGAGQPPDDALLQDVLKWFGTVTESERERGEIGARVEAGLGPAADSVWGKLLGLFASARGEVKYAAERTRETVAYRFRRMSELVTLVNRMAQACNARLREACGAEWLLVGEDFDKPGIPVARSEALFLTYGNLFRDLDLHLIFSLPISLAYSTRAAQLPLANESIYCIPDTPVYKRDHSAHAGGLAAVREVLAARVAESLFEESQLRRLIVASGGNLRDLFSLVSQASIEALIRKHARIEADDAGAAINGLRTEYERRLGESPFDDEKISYEAKAAKLVAIYSGEATASVPDAALHTLLRARAVQEFNGERWFGVHPLVVDVLEKQGKLQPRAGEGRVRGGTGDA